MYTTCSHSDNNNTIGYSLLSVVSPNRPKKLPLCLRVTFRLMTSLWSPDPEINGLTFTRLFLWPSIRYHFRHTSYPLRYPSHTRISFEISSKSFYLSLFISLTVFNMRLRAYGHLRWTFHTWRMFCWVLLSNRPQWNHQFHLKSASDRFHIWCESLTGRSQWKSRTPLLFWASLFWMIIICIAVYHLSCATEIDNVVVDTSCLKLFSL